MNSPAKIGMVWNILQLKLRLPRSVSGQEVEAKPAGNCRGRNSQRGPAMDRDDVAGLPSGIGWPMGRGHGRASALLAKSVFSASLERRRGAIKTVTGTPTDPVRHVIMYRIRKVHSTDEVLRRLTSPRWVTADYKPDAKCQLYAPVTGTESPRPRLRGWQQSWSRSVWDRSGGPIGCERQNLRVPTGSVRFMGPVSLAGEAAKWPEGTSSPQPANRLRTSPQQPQTAQTAVHPH